jgi:hypothetical protein
MDSVLHNYKIRGVLNSLPVRLGGGRARRRFRLGLHARRNTNKHNIEQFSETIRAQQSIVANGSISAQRAERLTQLQRRPAPPSFPPPAAPRTIRPPPPRARSSPRRLICGQRRRRRRRRRRIPPAGRRGGRKRPPLLRSGSLSLSLSFSGGRAGDGLVVRYIKVGGSLGVAAVEEWRRRRRWRRERGEVREERTRNGVQIDIL